MTGRSTAILALLLAISAGLVAWREHQRANRLQAQLASTSTQAAAPEEPAKQAVETIHPTRPAPAGEEPQNHELLRLRGEVTRLRAELEQANTGPAVHLKTWESESEIPEAGEATPQAAIQTFLSRLLAGRKEAILDSVVDLDEQPDSAALIKENVDSFAEMPAAAALAIESIRIAAERQTPEGDLQYLLLVTSGDGTGAAQWITLRQVGDTYKLGLRITRRPDGVSVNWNKQ